MTELKPMNEAPRDGREFLGLFCSTINMKCWLIIYFCDATSDGKNWMTHDEKFSHGLGFDEDEFLGWVPLPEIQESIK